MSKGCWYVVGGSEGPGWTHVSMLARAVGARRAATSACDESSGGAAHQLLGSLDLPVSLGPLSS